MDSIYKRLGASTKWALVVQNRGFGFALLFKSGSLRGLFLLNVEAGLCGGGGDILSRCAPLFMKSTSFAQENLF